MLIKSSDISYYDSVKNNWHGQMFDILESDDSIDIVYDMHSWIKENAPDSIFEVEIGNNGDITIHIQMSQSDAILFRLTF